jgi:hypothetical protein
LVIVVRNRKQILEIFGVLPAGVPIGTRPVPGEVRQRAPTDSRWRSANTEGE